MLKRTNPPYIATEYRVAPATEVGGRNIDPREDAKTRPRPTPRGAPMFRNFSLGAHMATVERPPTIPAVYHAALRRRGPPKIVRGATTAPITPECSIQARCFGPGLCSYDIECTSIPAPIMAAKVAPIVTQEPVIMKFMRAGVLATAKAINAVKPILPANTRRGEVIYLLLY